MCSFVHAQPLPQRDSDSSSTVGSLPQLPGELGWFRIMAAESFEVLHPFTWVGEIGQCAGAVLWARQGASQLAFVLIKSLSVSCELPGVPTILTLFPLCSAEEDVENFDVTNLSQDVLRSIEADSFWCMSKLLDGIQVSSGALGRVSPFDVASALYVPALGRFCYFTELNLWVKSCASRTSTVLTRDSQRQMILVLKSCVSLAHGALGSLWSCGCGLGHF